MTKMPYIYYCTIPDKSVPAAADTPHAAADTPHAAADTPHAAAVDTPITEKGGDGKKKQVRESKQFASRSKQGLRRTTKKKIDSRVK
jgi:hypothetical protein